ncbi:metallopeptidase family protein [Neoroseomonas oryzicola]|uniref:Metallopeptidase family protein n=1 Tax=Neoroseomonas oryzicola TaxID=535904 RepID=A0A9X9WHM1_9PROT|nr:metallopeptidase family protein [Neoroseomonas oryzicola]MBR0659831.1 metallopeptidase family protein [Neoroseomonas oryzicola]NKE19517.1 metallopeptidase family protein [Neoroseomonas oryzicola]
MRFSTPPGLDDLVEMAEHALAAIPAPLRDLVRGTAILVEDTPDDEITRDMGLESPWELTGLYQGVPLTAKSVGDIPREPDRILLFREPILLEWIETGEDLFRLVRNVLIHEIGHHFGLSDDDIARLEEDD